MPLAPAVLRELSKSVRRPGRRGRTVRLAGLRMEELKMGQLQALACLRSGGPALPHIHGMPKGRSA